MAARTKAYVGGSSAVELWRLLAEKQVTSGTRGVPRVRRYERNRQAQTPRKRRLRRGTGMGPLGLRFVREDSLPGRLPSKKLMADMLARELDGLSLPVRLLAPAGSARRSSQLMRSLRWPHDLPPRCLLGVSRRVRLCSPELCFLQMARSLDLIDLIELGFELCGSYSLPAHGDDGHFERDPLTTRELIRATVDRLPGAHSSDLARRALNYVHDVSASPAETKLCMLLCLPSRLGGQGLPAPQLNHRVYPPNGVQLLTGKGYLECDLYWPDLHLDVEYDSDKWHSGNVRREADAARRGDLKRLGIDVIEVTAAMLLDYDAMSVLGSDLARRLGVRRRTDSYDVEERRRQLHVRLTAPLRKVSGGWVPAEDDSPRLASWPELR